VISGMPIRPANAPQSDETLLGLSGLPSSWVQLADVAGHKVVALGVAQRLTQRSVGVADGARRQPASSQGRMPHLDIEPRQLLEQLDAQMWRDLVFDKLPVPLRGPRRDVAGRFPYVDAAPNPLGNCDLVRLDLPD
jgi:hypothetical protein